MGSDVLLGLCTAGGVQVLIFLPLTKKKVGALHIALSVTQIQCRIHNPGNGEQWEPLLGAAEEAS